MVALIPFFNSCLAGYVKEEPVYQTYKQPQRPSNDLFGYKVDGIEAAEHGLIHKIMVIGRDTIKVVNIKRDIGKKTIVDLDG